MLVFLRNCPFATVESFYAPSIGIRLPYPVSDTAELIDPATAAVRRIDRPGPYYAKCGVMLAELCSVGAGQADVFDTRDTDLRRLTTALDTINLESPVGKCPLDVDEALA
jgi:DNA polymerase V